VSKVGMKATFLPSHGGANMQIRTLPGGKSGDSLVMSGSYLAIQDALEGVP